MVDQLVAFVGASLVVIVVPGPDMMLLLRNTARAGRAGAVWTAAGIMTGLGLLAGAAAIGITAVLAASPLLFDVLRVAGGLYLLYLGAQALRTFLRQRRNRTQLNGPSSQAVTAPDALVSIRSSSFRQGLLCNLLNPKVAVFYLALFPQFNLAPLAPLTQHVLLAVLFWSMCLLWYLALVTLIGRISVVLQSATFARRTEALAAVALTGLGGFVLAHV